MNAEKIGKALDGTKQGGRWMARCPCHDDRTPSLSIKDGDDGKVLVHCFASCTQETVIETLKARGLWPERQRWPGRPDYSPALRTNVDRAGNSENRKRDAALRIWDEAKPAADTLVVEYLRSRKIEVPPPNSIRFHPALKYGPTKDRWPAMVALVTRGTDGEALAIHRTYLARDGCGKTPEHAKMMLGPCRGGAVRLAEPAERLLIGEGIETCLSVMQATDEPAWAALSTSGLRALQLPVEVRDVIVLADGDDAGEAAARRAAARWLREGRRVRIARPGTGLDFNDLLLGVSARDREAAS